MKTINDIYKEVSSIIYPPEIRAKIVEDKYQQYLEAYFIGQALAGIFNYEFDKKSGSNILAEDAVGVGIYAAKIYMGILKQRKNEAKEKIG